MKFSEKSLNFAIKGRIFRAIYEKKNENVKKYYIF